MSSKYRQIPKSVKLFFWMAAVCALSYFVLLHGWVISSADATWIVAGIFAICLSYGLPLSFFTSHFIHKPFGAWWKALLCAVLLFVIGVGLGFVTAYVHESLPFNAWNQLEMPPEPLAELVTTLPVGLFSGGVYGRTASGDLYLHSCSWGTCGWSKEDQLPVLTDQED